MDKKYEDNMYSSSMRESNMLEIQEDKNFTNERISSNLTLRKKKIDKYLSKYRIKKEGKKEYEINMAEINLDENIKNKIYSDLDEFVKEIKARIKSDNIENIKYALLSLRKQTLSNDTLNNKNSFVEVISKEDFISNILCSMQKFFQDKKILYEGLWTLINITYFSNDSNELMFYLSNSMCIHFYIKICELNDSTLSGNVYWLLANLIFNNNTFEITRKILFNIYMSPLLRVHILDVIENKRDLPTEQELNILRVLSRVSEFVSETMTQIINNDIREFKNFNKNVDYNTLKENNDYLFYHLMKLFIEKINIKEFSSYSIFALSKLTNYLDDSSICNLLFTSGLCRRLVRGEIETEEDFLSSTIQIIGNFLSYTDEAMIDKIFIDEIFNFFVLQIQKYPSKLYLKRDIFWAASNLTSGTPSACESFARSNLLQIALQSLYSDNEMVIGEALFALIGFFDIQNLEIIINYHHLDYIKNLFLCLKHIHSIHGSSTSYGNPEVILRLLNCIGFLFEDGEKCKQHCNFNKFANDFENNGGFELLETIESEHNLPKDVIKVIENLLAYHKK